MKITPRVLVLFGNVPLLGQEIGNIDAMSALKDTGCNVLFLIRREWTQDTIQAELRRRGLPWQYVPYFDTIRRGHGVRVWLRNIYGILAGSCFLLKVAYEFRPTHIHAANPSNVLNFLPALMLLRTPMVFRAGDAPVLHHWVWRWIWRFTIWRTSHFASISKFVDSQLINSGVPEEKISRVGTNVPNHRGGRSATTRALPEIDKDLFTFVYIGQLTRQKGIDLLVEAAINCCELSKDFQFVIAGDYSWNNSLAEELLAKVGEKGLSDRIVFAGYVDDVEGLLKLGQVLVCPSTYGEALGNVVIEAKAMARPSIVFPTGGLVELVEHGKDGYVCKDKSSADLTAAFLSYQSSPGLAQKQGQEALRSLSKLCGNGGFAEQWRAIYDSIG